MQKSQKRAAELIEAFETLNRAKKVFIRSLLYKNLLVQFALCK